MVDKTLQYRNKVSMNFIHAGTTVLMVKDGERILITADMDGHIVSADYGKLYDASRTHFADNPEKNYINVCVNAFEKDYRASNRKGGDWHVNDSVYERDGWDFLVNDKVYDRYKKDLDLFQRQGQELLEARRLQIEADLAHAEADLARARSELARIK